MFTDGQTDGQRTLAFSSGELKVEMQNYHLRFKIKDALLKYGVCPNLILCKVIKLWHYVVCVTVSGLALVSSTCIV